MNVAVVSLFLLGCLATHAAGAGPLHSILQQHVHGFNHSELLRDGLRFAAEVSVQLLQSRLYAKNVSNLALSSTLLDPPSGADTPGAVLAAARDSLPVADQYDAAEPVLAVLARRVMLARIALVWLASGERPFSYENEMTLSDIIRVLYGLHVRSLVRRGVMQHLHISKSSGTSFSGAARASRCSMYPGLSQPRYLRDQAHWLNRTAFIEHTGASRRIWALYGHVQRDTNIQTCGQRLEAVVSHGLQYISNEYTLHGGLEDMRATHVCPQLVNVVTLRNPDKRLASHIYFVLSNFVGPFRRNHPEDPDFFNRIFCSGNHTIWYEIATPMLDNYNVRCFIGERGFHTPLGGIGHEHLSVARRLLLQFDLVVDLDAGAEASSTIMRQGLGWNVTLADIHSRDGGRVSQMHGFDPDAESCRNEALLREVLPRQEPDRQLYRAGRVVSFLDGVLLSMAHSLGLRPHPDTAKDATADTALDNQRYPCGLMSFAARYWPPRPPKPVRAPRGPSENGDGKDGEIDEREDDYEGEEGEEAAGDAGGPR